MNRKQNGRQEKTIENGLGRQFLLFYHFFGVRTAHRCVLRFCQRAQIEVTGCLVFLRTKRERVFGLITCTLEHTRTFRGGTFCTRTFALLMAATLVASDRPIITSVSHSGFSARKVHTVIFLQQVVQFEKIREIVSVSLPGTLDDKVAKKIQYDAFIKSY